jgi:hypothetical protein
MRLREGVKRRSGFAPIDDAETEKMLAIADGEARRGIEVGIETFTHLSKPDENSATERPTIP